MADRPTWTYTCTVNGKDTLEVRGSGHRVRLTIVTRPIDLYVELDKKQARDLGILLTAMATFGKTIEED